jgi:hypothetical protein
MAKKKVIVQKLGVPSIESRLTVAAQAVHKLQEEGLVSAEVEAIFEALNCRVALCNGVDVNGRDGYTRTVYIGYDAHNGDYYTSLVGLAWKPFPTLLELLNKI